MRLNLNSAHPLGSYQRCLAVPFYLPCHSTMRMRKSTMWSRAAILYQRTVSRVISLPTSKRLSFGASLSTASNYRVFQLKRSSCLRNLLRCSHNNAAEEGGHIPGHFQIMFTCNICETRNSKKISKQAYYNGIVVIRCQECDNLHLIADNLGWFGQGKKCVLHHSILLYFKWVDQQCYKEVVVVHYRTCLYQTVSS